MGGELGEGEDDDDDDGDDDDDDDGGVQQIGEDTKQKYNLLLKTSI